MSQNLNTLSERGDEVNSRYFLFLFLGVERSYIVGGERDSTVMVMSEPSGSIICRRNILALGGIVAIAGFAGVDPHDLNVFGVNFSGERGALALGLAVSLTQLYWYVMRYHHLTEDAAVFDTRENIERRIGNLGHYYCIKRKTADLLANLAAVILTVASLFIIVTWVFMDACPS